ncbi:MAG: transglycosylase domain-containing protein, partial [Macromonas sp.]
MRGVWRWLLWVMLAGLALQLFFVGRIALMAVIDPQSTAFQRSEAWRMATQPRAFTWHQQWLDYGAISPHLKRAVLAAEDSGFNQHDGVDWDALEAAWERNERSAAQAEAQVAQGKYPHQ